MSSVNVDRPNCDIINVAVEQTGKSEMSVFFKKPILSEDRNYVVCVSGLSVPMFNTNLLPKTAEVDLFHIYRRNAGQDQTDHNQIDLHGAGQINGIGLGAATIASMPQALVGDFHIRRIPVKNISDFLLLLNSFAATFENRIAAVGINPLLYGAVTITPVNPPEAIGTVGGADPVPMLRFGLSPSGIIIITFSPLFANHFFVDFSEMGKTLFGLDTDRIAMTQNQVNGVITRFGEGMITQAAGNIIQPATVTVPVVVYGKLSLLSTLESRLSVHLESDLPIMKTIVSQNQVEQSVYDLASFVLKNESSSTIHVDGTKVENEFEFETHTHSGQVVLQSRTEQPTQYSPLLDADLRTLRLRLYIKTKEYNAITKQWNISKKEFPISKGDHWNCDLRFISTE